MRLDHVAIVHAVQLITGEDQHILDAPLLNISQVLSHGVGGTLIPMLIDALLRGHDIDKLAQLPAQERPPSWNKL